MKTFAIFFALFSLCLGVFALPASTDGIAIGRRDAVDEALTTVQSLYATVQQYTAVINSTSAALGADATDLDKAAAGETITAAIASINTAVVDATTQVSESSTSKRSVIVVRQADELETTLINLLLDISGALNNVIANLGLTATLSFLGPLVSSLSGLLLALDGVVDDLLALVQQIVDGLLIGLSAALAGLVL